MRVISVEISHFRNITGVSFFPDPGKTVLVGDNAQGKTNLLEAVWMFTGNRSFRGARDRDLVQNGQTAAVLKMAFEAQGREQTAQIAVSPLRQAWLNGVKLRQMSELAGRFCAVIFTPDHLSMLKNGPNERRRFWDTGCCQMFPAAAADLARYMRTLSQRNGLLKMIRAGQTTGFGPLLDSFDETLSASGAKLREKRRQYFAALWEKTREIYENIAGHRDRIGVRLSCGEEEKPLSQLLRENRERDIRAGFTGDGPHRDDFTVCVNGMPAKIYASQGQQRSVVLAMALAQAALLTERYGEQPVMLLDDVMSELDLSRQKVVLESFGDWQGILTCCDASSRVADGGKKIWVRNGRISEA